MRYPASEKFAARFTSKEEYDRFEQEFNKAIAHNEKVGGGKKDSKEDYIEKVYLAAKEKVL